MFVSDQFSAIELQEEGKNAIESPTSPTVPDIGPEGYQLGELSVFNTVKFLNIRIPKKFAVITLKLYYRVTSPKCRQNGKQCTGRPC